MRNESISESCRKLIGKYLGLDILEKFKYLYKIRSQLVHKGKANNEISLKNEVIKLEELISRLLKILIFDDETYNAIINFKSSMEPEKISQHIEIIQ